MRYCAPRGPRSRSRSSGALSQAGRALRRPTSGSLPRSGRSAGSRRRSPLSSPGSRSSRGAPRPTSTSGRSRGPARGGAASLRGRAPGCADGGPRPDAPRGAAMTPARAWLGALAALAAGCRASPPSSLLLVSIDTLRADRVGAYGSRAGATPNLDALAVRGVVFEEARASAPLTLPSHSTILSGLEPVHHGVRDNGSYVFPEDVPTLATRLKASGFATGAFVGAYVLDRRFGLARGFDAYDDKIARRASGQSGLESERPCDAVVDAA